MWKEAVKWLMKYQPDVCLCCSPLNLDCRSQLSVEHKHQCALCVQFAEKYGDVFSLRLFGGRVVIVTSYKHVREALVQKGEDYADRPVIPLFDDLVGNKGSVCVLRFVYEVASEY